jgi:hypothetical protein
VILIHPDRVAGPCALAASSAPKTHSLPSAEAAYNSAVFANGPTRGRENVAKCPASLCEALHREEALKPLILRSSRKIRRIAAKE